MKYFSIIFRVMFLFVLGQSNSVVADIFTTTNKNIRIQVTDYRDLLQDIIFWIHHAEDTPVVTQALVNNGVYPISVTIYNESVAPIKVIKTAVGGLSTAQEHEVAELYQYDVFASIVEKIVLGTVAVFIGVEALNIMSGGRLESTLKTDTADWYTKFKYATSSLSGLCVGGMHWPAVAATNALIKQTFASQALPEELTVAPGCSMTFLLFATHAPAGYTLKVPIFDEHDTQIASFSCPFEVATAA